jgi:hypothetical protein
MQMKKTTLLFSLLLLFFATLNAQKSGNPVFPGRYADPEATVLGDKYWIYPTFSAPYNQQVFMDAFSSSDLVNWTKHSNIIDTAQVKWAKRAMWAPAIVEKGGKYYLFFAANDIQSNESEGGIGIGVSERPEGPFRDYLERPLIDKFHNGAGHNSVINVPGTDEWFIVYHRRPLTEKDGNSRMTCIDKLEFGADDKILPVVMTNEGVGARPVNKINSFAGQKKTSQKYIQLFNGKNLEGWYTFLKGKGKNSDPNEVFTVKNGNIVISGEEFGCITTDEEFENYKLTVEFKWGERTFAPRVDRARDSGILLHSVGEDGGSGGIWMYSIESQIIEGGTGDIIIVGDGTDNFSATTTVKPGELEESCFYDPEGEARTFVRGRIDWHSRDPQWEDKKDFRGVNDVERPVGQWNRIECYAIGSELLIYLNGKLVNRACSVKPQKGKIQIQSEGAEIFIRKVDLQRL